MESCALRSLHPDIHDITNSRCLCRNLIIYSCGVCVFVVGVLLSYKGAPRLLLRRASPPPAKRWPCTTRAAPGALPSSSPLSLPRPGGPQRRRGRGVVVAEGHSERRATSAPLCFPALGKEREALPSRARERTPRSEAPGQTCVWRPAPDRWRLSGKSSWREGARSGRGARLVSLGVQKQLDDLNAVVGGCNVQRGVASEKGWRRRRDSRAGGPWRARGETRGRREGRRGCSSHRAARKDQGIQPDGAMGSKRQAAAVDAGRPSCRYLGHPGWPCRGARSSLCVGLSGEKEGA